MQLQSVTSSGISYTSSPFQGSKWPLQVSQWHTTPTPGMDSVSFQTPTLTFCGSREEAGNALIYLARKGGGVGAILGAIALGWQLLTDNNPPGLGVFDLLLGIPAAGLSGYGLHLWNKANEFKDHAASFFTKFTKSTAAFGISLGAGWLTLMNGLDVTDWFTGGVALIAFIFGFTPWKNKN